MTVFIEVFDMNGLLPDLFSVDWLEATPNGVTDASEFSMLYRTLKTAEDPDHDETWEAWDENYAAYRDFVVEIGLYDADDIQSDDARVLRALTAYVTIDPVSKVFADRLLAGYINRACDPYHGDMTTCDCMTDNFHCIPEDTNNYVFLGPDDDYDDDGFWNADEWQWCNISVYRPLADYDAMHNMYFQLAVLFYVLAARNPASLPIYDTSSYYTIPDGLELVGVEIAVQNDGQGTDPGTTTPSPRPTESVPKYWLPKYHYGCDTASGENCHPHLAVSAIANEGWQFTQWTGDLDSGASATATQTMLTLDDDKTLTAHFRDSFTLTIQQPKTANSGTTSPAAGEYTYAPGTEVEVTATPAVGYNFLHWTGDAGGSDETLTLTMNRDYTIKPVFEGPTIHLHVNSGGLVTVFYDCPPYYSSRSYTEPGGEREIPYGCDVRLTASAGAGHYFDRWLCPSLGEYHDTRTNPIMLTNFTTSITIEAVFTPGYRLTVAKTPSTAPDPLPAPGVYYHPTGSKVRLFSAAASCIGSDDNYYAFTGWTPASALTPDGFGDAVVMNGNKTVTANFQQGHRLTITRTGDHGRIVAPSQEVYPAGTVIELSAETEAGWHLFKWRRGSEIAYSEPCTDDALYDTSYVFIMPDEDVDVEAVFSPEVLFPGNEPLEGTIRRQILQNFPQYSCSPIILRAHLDAITSADLSLGSIVSLDGIEQWGNLMQLNLSNNQIVEIDPLLELPLLIYLDLWNNANLSARSACTIIPVLEQRGVHVVADMSVCNGRNRSTLCGECGVAISELGTCELTWKTTEVYESHTLSSYNLNISIFPDPWNALNRYMGFNFQLWEVSSFTSENNVGVGPGGLRDINFSLSIQEEELLRNGGYYLIVEGTLIDTGVTYPIYSGGFFGEECPWGITKEDVLLNAPTGSTGKLFVCDFSGNADTESANAVRYRTFCNDMFMPLWDRSEYCSRNASAWLLLEVTRTSESDLKNTDIKYDLMEYSECKINAPYAISRIVGNSDRTNRQLRGIFLGFIRNSLYDPEYWNTSSDGRNRYDFGGINRSGNLNPFELNSAYQGWTDNGYSCSSTLRPYLTPSDEPTIGYRSSMQAFAFMLAGGIGCYIDILAHPPHVSDPGPGPCYSSFNQNILEAINLFDSTITPLSSTSVDVPNYPNPTGSYDELSEKIDASGRYHILFNDYNNLNDVLVTEMPDGNVQIEAIAGEGCRFTHWEGDVSGTENPLILEMAASKDGGAECCGAPYSAACNANAIVRAVFDECTYIRVIPWISPNLEYWDGPCSNSDAYRYDGAARYCGDDWDMYVADGNACLYTEENGVKILEVEPGETAVRIGTNSEAGGYWHHTWRHQEAASQLPGSEGQSGEPVRWYGADATLDSSSSVTVHLYFGPAFGGERPVYDQTLPPMVRESLSVTVSGGPAQVRFGQEGCVCNLGGHPLPFVLGEADETGGTFGYSEFWREPLRPGDDGYSPDNLDRLEVQPLPGYQLDSVTWTPSAFRDAFEHSAAGEDGGSGFSVDLPDPAANTQWNVAVTVEASPVAEVRVFSDPAQGRAFIRSKPLSGPRSDGCPEQYASGVYNVGDQILLRAVPKNCETFSHWEDGNGTKLGDDGVPELEYTVPAVDGEEKSGFLYPLILIKAVFSFASQIVKIPLGGTAVLPEMAVGKVYIPTRFGGTLSLSGGDLELYYSSGVDLTDGAAELIAHGEYNSYLVESGSPCNREIPLDEYGWYYVRARSAPSTAITALFMQTAESPERPWNFYWWPYKCDYIYEIKSGGNGVADSTAVSGSDDVQVIEPGSAVAGGQEIVNAGYDGILQTACPPDSKETIQTFDNLYDAGGALEKYDSIFGTNALQEETKVPIYPIARHFGGAELDGWEGHCIGGALASIFLNQPEPAPGVSLSQDELEGLWIEIFNNPWGALYEEIMNGCPAGPPISGADDTDKYCGGFHNVLEVGLKTNEKALLSNLRGEGASPEPVWNHAVWKYKSLFSEAPGGDEHLVEILTNIYANKDHEPPTNGTEDRECVYKYIVLYDSDGEVLVESNMNDWISVSGSANFAPQNILYCPEPDTANPYANQYVTVTNVRSIDSNN